jgi:hypothetical protein
VRHEQPASGCLVEHPLEPSAPGIVPAEQPLHRRAGDREPHAVVAVGGFLGRLIHDGQRGLEPAGLHQRLGERELALGAQAWIRPARRDEPVGGDRRRLRAHEGSRGA